jgi:hypothetical protein
MSRRRWRAIPTVKVQFSGYRSAGGIALHIRIGGRLTIARPWFAFPAFRVNVETSIF